VGGRYTAQGINDDILDSVDEFLHATSEPSWPWFSRGARSNRAPHSPSVAQVDRSLRLLDVVDGHLATYLAQPRCPLGGIEHDPDAVVVHDDGGDDHKGDA